MSFSKVSKCKNEFYTLIYSCSAMLMLRILSTDKREGENPGQEGTQDIPLIEKSISKDILILFVDVSSTVDNTKVLWQIIC